MFESFKKLISKLLVLTIMCIGFVPTTMASSSTIKLTGITLSQTSLSLSKGNTATLTATLSPSNTAVTWSSSKTSVVTVSSSGKITAKKVGTATITCKAKDKSGEKAACKVTVK